MDSDSINSDDCLINGNVDEQISLFDDMVDDLWNNVIVKYINNGNILTLLSTDDKTKFYEYMLNNSDAIKELYKMREDNI
ncbi:hypothetical protein Catovirus_1_1080 [Catovirus CTV1]|uniref:Uncharacterized protein n=1 Tax=Catovirus CTV1 TaxID=1977631 RepID=A0A1V0SBC2_9VIRU|nr:hypothetical protein Catovirus_1_1080 [Catovirus CTV1]